MAKLKKNIIYCMYICIIIVLIIIVIASIFVSSRRIDAYEEISKTTVRFHKQTDLEDAWIMKNSNEDLKLLILSDPQIDVSNKYKVIGASNSLTYDFIEKLINLKKPDLVIITGDLVMSNRFNQWKYLKRYAEMFEDLNTLWTFCFGNHDSENIHVNKENTIYSIFGQMSKENVFKALYKYPHCLVSKEKSEFNFNINIIDESNSIIRNLFFFDCEYVNESDTLDYSKIATDKQVTWYKESVENLLEKTRSDSNKFNDNLLSSVFIHTPLPEYLYAITYLKEGIDYEYIYGDLLFGDYQEYMNDCGLFTALDFYNSTDTVFFGHHHDNDESIIYKGIQMTSVQHSGFAHRYRISFPDGLKGNVIDFSLIDKYQDNRGGVELLIHNDGTYTQERIIARTDVPDYNDFKIDYKRIKTKLSNKYTIITG